MLPTLDTLLLVPTEYEQQKLLDFGLRISIVDLQLCGFGPLAAGIATARLLATKPYRRVVMAGIAGAFDKSIKLATAISFDRVTLDGIGVIDAGLLKTGMELGFKPSLADCYPLEPLDGTTNQHLLTSCVACESDAFRIERTARYPTAVAEDMEGFAVAAACHQAGLPLTIVRGLSNIVGDRDKQNWQIDAALSAVADWLNHHLPEIHG